MPPTPSAGELAEAVRSVVPGADIMFEPDPELVGIVASMRTFDDRAARDEWGWIPSFDLEAMIDDLVTEVRSGR